MTDPDPIRSKSTASDRPPVDPGADTLDGTSSGPSASAPDPLVGRMLAHYRVDAQIGRGGMGAVYRAWDDALQRPVALKVLLEDTEQTRQRFLREARAQARIKHPNVVPIHFVGEHEGVAFLVMDLVEGESLSAVLAREGAFGPERALDVADAVACALEVGAEHGLVHRDVKPGNVLIDRRGHVMLADFGLAKWMGSAEPESPASAEQRSPPQEPSPGPSHSGVVTRAGALVGTPAYAAPEQTRGEIVDARTDIYALGVTLYEVLTGQPPFSAPTITGLVSQHREDAPLSPRALAPTLPAPVEALVMRMMAKRPEDRFASPAALREAIAAARDRPRSDANAFVRALALVIDFAFFGIGGLLAALVLEPLAMPVLVGLMGAFEGSLGFTPAKGLLQLRVVDARGEPPGIRRGLIRAVGKLWGPLAAALSSSLLPEGAIVDAIQTLCILGWLASSSAILFGTHRALHDRVAGTRVVYAI